VWGGLGGLPRLAPVAETPDVTVLLIEAGGDDALPAVTDAARWITNLGSERNWQFQTRPAPQLSGRSLAWNMGKVLGAAWSYASILEICRRIEDWHGEPDPERRGTGGLVFFQPPPDPSPIAPAMLEAARSFDVRVTTGNTMAPCVIIGERAAEMIRRRHGLFASGRSF